MVGWFVCGWKVEWLFGGVCDYVIWEVWYCGFGEILMEIVCN